MAATSLCVSLPCTRSVCTNPVHNILFHSCSQKKLSWFFNQSLCNTTLVWSSLKWMKKSLLILVQSLLLLNVIYYMLQILETPIVALDEPEHINIARSNFLVINLNIHNIPAHIDELSVLLESSARPNVTILSISETWLSGMNESLLCS